MSIFRTLLSAGFAAVLLAAPAVAQDHPGAQPTQTAPDATSAEARRADIAVFRERFLAADRSYAADARAEAERRLTVLEGEAGAVSQAYFELELARIVALADNGHTAYFPGPRSRRFNRIDGVRLAPLGEDFFVLRATEGNADLLGARLVAVDGHPIADVRAVARSLAGGVSSWRDRNAPYFFESPEQMHALGVIASAERASYRFQLANGRIVTRRFDIDPPNPNRVRANSDRWFYPAPVAEEGGAWRALLNADAAPWSLRDPDQAFRMRDAPEMDAFVIEMRQNVSSDDVDIAEFMLDALEAARTSGRHNIVLDMRMNGGGDLNNTRAWVRRLPRIVTGKVYVLTSPYTFSAAISTVGYLKQSAPDRVVIVGEHVGDRLNFFAEGDVITLPHSGGAILNATERHDYVTGCAGLDDCHGSVVRNPIRVPNLDVEIAAPWTIAAYRAGRDPAMEAVAAAIRAGG
ncbi:hypothetical protein [Terricaulis sp.]|uniref:hypothetical protein n=1 Tax=Terricaulis sp. TaxID=2768686 RepID=UPI003784B169